MKNWKFRYKNPYVSVGEKKMINMSLEDYQFMRILMKLPKKKYVINGKLRYVKNSYIGKWRRIIDNRIFKKFNNQSF